MNGSAGLDFQYLRCSCLCSPARDLEFGSAGAGNDLRGALGYVLPEQWFRPKAAAGPSGLRDSPRPFVLRVAGIPEKIAAGGVFRFGVHLFDQEGQGRIEEALSRVARAGLGPDRIPFAYLLDWETVRFPLEASENPLDSLRVEFVTPTELKGHEGRGAPPFDVLVARARDRVSSLRAAYGPGPLDVDFAGLRERAREVRIAAAELAHDRARRISTRTRQAHDLAGLVGWVRYEGPVGEFLRILKVAECTGVGRHTVWGFGEIQVTTGPAW